MGIVYKRFLDGYPRVFCCKCKTHVSHSEALVSKAFQGHHGKAWLFDEVVNIIEGEPEDRPMTTGHHTVKDIYCTNCRELLGWKYERAEDESQKYKEGV
ncbi:hypothetical protein HDU85_002430 [Gaertneriomyces sp. JEL0708]|nr:hypothetical protein HDU85_002430 [Gaertneriomyces sp. JEL0708]